MDDHAQDTLLSRLEEGRREFLALVAELRPDLHRYCARMTGSVADGEDVVQDTLASAYYALSQLRDRSLLRPWLFRIAHHRALDLLRRNAHRASEPLDVAEDMPADDALAPDSALARDQALRAALSSFLQLAPAQRACVVMKDVLDHSLEEIASLLDTSVPAVKSALHRGRTQLRLRGEEPEATGGARAASAALVRYARLFNLRDWDGVRDMLIDDVSLDLVSRDRLVGRVEVGRYFTNYARVSDWHLVPAWLDGVEVIAVLAHAQATRPSYFIQLTLVDGRVGAIRDYRHVPYIARDAAFGVCAADS